jgi:hypothetical protein
MKKLLLTLLCLIPAITFAQTGPAAPGAGNYLLIDTTYTVGTSVANQTKARVTYKNSTSTKVTGVQFRVFYDKVAFKTPSVALVTANPDLNLQHVVDITNGHITVTLVYIGSSSTYTLPNAETFEITFNHAPAATFQNLTAIDSMKFTGASSYSPIASTQSGMDTALTLHNFGGYFFRPKLDFAATFTNVTGTPSKNLTVSLEKKPKTSGSWAIVTTKSTGTTGVVNFSEFIDTTYWAVRLQVKGDTISTGPIVSVADAQKVNQFVLGTATPVGFDFYSSDVNGDNALTISDAYVIFGRIAGRFSTWVNNVKDIKFFTPSEYTTINTSTTNLTSTIPGVTNFTYNIVGGGPSSVTYYVLGMGDANGTGI